MKQQKTTQFRLYILILLLTTVIFLCLYHPFIFGDKMYAYSDIGADTINQYLPMGVYEMRTIADGTMGQYDLQLGLGAYNNALVKNLNPGNLPVLLLGENLLHVGLLVSTYVKHVLMGIVALAFFLRLLRHEKAACLAAILWTFCSYNVLWGQHYQFLTSTLAFTVAVYGFQRYLEDDRKILWAVLAMIYLTLTSYFFLYMSCWFLLAYGVLYLKLNGAKWGEVLKKAGRFALSMIPVVLVSAVYLLPSAEKFLSSARVNQVTAGIGGLDLLYNVGTILSFAGRFLSTDLIGTGNYFHGPANYYECAILSVSLLALFSVCYLLQGKCRKPVLGITLGCGILLLTPLTSGMLVFTPENQRWTYMLCFAQVIAIGFALKDISENREDPLCRKKLLRSLVIADVLLGLLACVMVAYDFYSGGNWLSRKACLNLVLIAIVYHGVFLAFFKVKRLYPLLLAAVVLEMVLCNYATVNDRGVITKEQWYSDMYNDGTEAVVQWIRERDPGIYRINKTYHSAYYTDSLVQGYYGMGIYSSTNTRELLELSHDYGYSYARNWLGFDGTDLLANSMLGVKYVIAEEGTYLDPDYFTPIYEDDTFAVYENRYYLGFGYVYDWETSAGISPEGTTLEKALTLSGGYALTEDPAQPQAEGVRSIDLLPWLTECYQCEGTEEGETLTLTGTSADMLLYFTVPQLEEGWRVSGVRVTMRTETPSNIKLFTATDHYDFCVEHYDYVTYAPGEQTFWLDNTVLEDVRSLRLDVSDVAQNVTISSVELIAVDTELLRSNLESLKKTAVTDMTQQGNMFSCTAENPYDDQAMLCLPLIYSENWRVCVDGEAVQPVNINGGLTGIPIAPGSHRLTLEYDDGVHRLGYWISLSSLVLLLGAAGAVSLAGKRKKKQ